MAPRACKPACTLNAFVELDELGNQHIFVAFVGDDNLILPKHVARLLDALVGPEVDECTPQLKMRNMLKMQVEQPEDHKNPKRKSAENH